MNQTLLSRLWQARALVLRCLASIVLVASGALLKAQWPWLVTLLIASLGIYFFIRTAVRRHHAPFAAPGLAAAAAATACDTTALETESVASVSGAEAINFMEERHELTFMLPPDTGKPESGAYIAKLPRLAAFLDAPSAAAAMDNLITHGSNVAPEASATLDSQTAVAPPTVAPSGEYPSGANGLVRANKGIDIAGGNGGYSIIPREIQERLDSHDSRERAESVLALSQLNVAEAFGQICIAFDDPKAEVRGVAARSLYNLGVDRTEAFTRALREAGPERRRHIGTSLASSGLADEAIMSLTDASRERTYEAFALLFLMAKTGEVAPLIHAVESHPDREVRLAVVNLLALSGQHGILPSFHRLAVRGSLPTEVRSAVMDAIYRLGSNGQSVAVS